MCQISDFPQMSQEDLSPGSDKTLARYYVLTKMTHYVLLKPRWSNVADEKCLFPCYRAFARVGNAYFKKEDYNNALLYFNKSLSEHRDPEIVKKSQEVSSHRISFIISLGIRDYSPIYSQNSYGAVSLKDL